MKTNGIVDSALKAAAELKSAACPATTASTTALTPLISLLPKVLPFVARSLRRYPVQAAIAGLLLLAAAQRRRSTRRRYSPYFD